VKRTLQPRPLHDCTRCFMPLSNRRPLSAIILTFLLVLTLSSCHKRQVAVPVPSEPTPVPAVELPQQPVIVTQPVIAPPPTATVPVQAPPPKDETNYQKNKAAEQPPPPKRVTHPANPPPTAPASQSPPPTSTETPLLGDVLTPEQQQKHIAAIELSLAHAQASLGYIASRQLTKEQEATVAEIRNFIQQAQEKRKDDLAAAKSLAERAEVLSHDLVASLRK
jgi:hypothetical protein